MSYAMALKSMGAQEDHSKKAVKAKKLELSRQASLDRKKYEEKINRRRRTSVKAAIGNQIGKPLATLKGISKRETCERVSDECESSQAAKANAPKSISSV